MTSQEEKLILFVSQNEYVLELIHAVPKLGLPNCYVAGGCIAQTLWSLSHGYKAHHGIKDLDLVYFDADLLEDKEREQQSRIERMFAHFPMDVDVINEARVHLWYKNVFGYDIKPYTSVEEAISSFPVTAGVLGIRSHGKGYEIYTPLGLEDVLNCLVLVKLSKRQITKELYEAKLERWRQVWPKLTYIP
ncbi:MAG: nucleotidyltransferase family protein [Trueperaceae bacterium]